MSEIESCIDTAIANINLVLNDLYSMIELDNNVSATVSQVNTELKNIRSTLEQYKKDVQSNSNTVDAKRRFLGL